MHLSQTGMVKNNYLDIVEIPNARVSKEQLERTFNRYMFAREMSCENDVLDIGCGTGIGLNLIIDSAKSLTCGDIDKEVLEILRDKYESDVDILQVNAEDLSFENDSFDLLIFFEAIYYLEDAIKFIRESKRVLRNDGKILISTANNALYDFTPSKYSTNYYNVPDLQRILSDEGFADIEFYGFHHVGNVSLRQKILRPLKALASILNLVPGSMKNKEFLKKFYFGDLILMPDKLEKDMMTYSKPIEIDGESVNYDFKIIYCVATKIL